MLGIGAYDDFQLNLAAAEDTSAEDYLDQVAILDALQVNRQWNYALGVKYDKFTGDSRWTWVASRVLSNRAYKHVDNDDALPLPSITSRRRWRTSCASNGAPMEKTDSR